MRRFCSLFLGLSVILHGGFLAAQLNQFITKDMLERKNDKPRIICFGAHPDDAEIRAGGSAILWAAHGCEVAFVSTTNGNLGHWRDVGGTLAKRRYAEVQEAAKILGTKTFVWDNHDGELEPNLENRRRFIRAVRQWQADVVIAHRPNDYHPDHRYTGILMQDAAFLVNIPQQCPDVAHLEKMPIYLYSYDAFQNPPFRVDIAVALDDVIDKKLDALMLMESQFVEGGALAQGGVSGTHWDSRTASTDPRVREELRAETRERLRRRFAAIADVARDKLIELYGQEYGSKVKYAEAFEVCEYGRPPTHERRTLTPEEIKRYFPFITKK